MSSERLPCLIVGSSGQDGRLLSELCEREGNRVVRLSRQSLIWPDGREGGSVDLLDAQAVRSLMKQVGDSEIYYLPTFHHASEEQQPGPATLFRQSQRVHVDGLLNFLEGMRLDAPGSRLFYAASSRVFREDVAVKLNEESRKEPVEPYGITKLMGVEVCDYYRETLGLYAASGFLFNHESKFRSPLFLSMKVAQAAARASRGMSVDLVLGDLQAVTDWGFAPDFVRAMRAMLGIHVPRNFVVATGERHTVQDFVEIAFSHVNLDWRGYVRQEKGGARSQGVRIGDSSALRRETGWQPSVSFREMVGLLVDAAARRLDRDDKIFD